MVIWGFAIHRKSIDFGPFLESPSSVLAAEKRVLLLKYPNYLEVWRLGLPSTNVQLVDDELEKRKYLTLQEVRER